MRKNADRGPSLTPPDPGPDSASSPEIVLLQDVENWVRCKASASSLPRVRIAVLSYSFL